jgi:hypothetical protein
MGVTTALVILKRGGIYCGIGLLELLCKVVQVCGTIASRQLSSSKATACMAASLQKGIGMVMIEAELTQQLVHIKQA